MITLSHERGMMLLTALLGGAEAQRLKVRLMDHKNEPFDMNAVRAAMVDYFGEQDGDVLYEALLRAMRD